MRAVEPGSTALSSATTWRRFSPPTTSALPWPTLRSSPCSGGRDELHPLPERAGPRPEPGFHGARGIGAAARTDGRGFPFSQYAVRHLQRFELGTPYPA